METQPRRQAMWQGALGVIIAPLWLVVLGRSLASFSHPREGLQRMLVIGLLFVGLAIAVVGVWRLSVARDRRWDLPGIVALCLILFPGLPTLFLFLYLVVSGFMGQIFGGT